jgi:hypothetical protein
MSLTGPFSRPLQPFLMPLLLLLEFASLACDLLPQRGGLPLQFRALSRAVDHLCRGE